MEVHPLIAPETPSFALDGIRYHGHDLCIAWQKPGTPQLIPDHLNGFRVYVDGKLQRQLDTPSAFTLAHAP